jgi:transmembrane sensor
MEPISEQAARWAVRSLGDSFGPDEQRDLAIWLEADPRHLGAYVRARAQWVDLDRLAALNGPASPVRKDAPALRAMPRQPWGDEANKRPGVSRRRVLGSGLAVATLAGVGLVGLAIRARATRYTSGIGEIRRIALDDGSTMVLNTATEVTVEFSKRQRTLRLIRGEAFFEVAHDKERPFVVQANAIGIRAVGTAFAVRLDTSRLDITVTEGIVEVSDSTEKSVADAAIASSPVPQHVAANQRIVITGSRVPDVRPVSPSESDRELAWREGMVSFDGESLQTAVTEINRHNRRHIIIDDAALAAMPVVGVFQATDLDAFSAAAASALKATAVRDGNVIRLQRRLPEN